MNDDKWVSGVGDKSQNNESQLQPAEKENNEMSMQINLDLPIIICDEKGCVISRLENGWSLENELSASIDNPNNIEPEIIVDQHPLFGREDFWLMEIGETVSQPVEVCPNKVSKEQALITSSGMEITSSGVVSSETCESSLNKVSDGLQQKIREIIGSVGGVCAIRSNGGLDQDESSNDVSHLVSPDEQLTAGSIKITPNQQRLHNSAKIRRVLMSEIGGKTTNRLFDELNDATTTTEIQLIKNSIMDKFHAIQKLKILEKRELELQISKTKLNNIDRAPVIQGINRKPKKANPNCEQLNNQSAVIPQVNDPAISSNTSTSSANHSKEGCPFTIELPQINKMNMKEWSKGDAGHIRQKVNATVETVEEIVKQKPVKNMDIVDKAASETMCAGMDKEREEIEIALFGDLLSESDLSENEDMGEMAKEKEN